MSLVKSVEFLRDFHQITDIEIEFIGSGKMLKKCINYVKKKRLSNQIKFLSEVEHQQLNFYYNN